MLKSCRKELVCPTATKNIVEIRSGLKVKKGKTYQKVQKEKKEKLENRFGTSIQIINIENPKPTLELGLVGGWIDGWMGVKPGLRNYLAQSKNTTVYFSFINVNSIVQSTY
jgi:hypothetical protein